MYYYCIGLLFSVVLLEWTFLGCGVWFTWLRRWQCNDFTAFCPLHVSRPHSLWFASTQIVRAAGVAKPGFIKRPNSAPKSSVGVRRNSFHHLHRHRPLASLSIEIRSQHGRNHSNKEVKYQRPRRDTGPPGHQHFVISLRTRRRRRFTTMSHLIGQGAAKLHTSI